MRGFATLDSEGESLGLEVARTVMGGIARLYSRRSPFAYEGDLTRHNSRHGCLLKVRSSDLLDEHRGCAG